MTHEIYQYEPENPRKITGAKERKTLNALLEKPCTRYELDQEARTCNAAEFVSRLRQRGLNIEAPRFKIQTDDGVVYLANYILTPQSKPLARQLLGNAP